MLFEYYLIGFGAFSRPIEGCESRIVRNARLWFVLVSLSIEDPALEKAGVPQWYMDRIWYGAGTSTYALGLQNGQPFFRLEPIARLCGVSCNHRLADDPKTTR